jgi:hypothetical protein
VLRLGRAQHVFVSDSAARSCGSASPSTVGTLGAFSSGSLSLGITELHGQVRTLLLQDSVLHFMLSQVSTDLALNLVGETRHLGGQRVQHVIHP